METRSHKSLFGKDPARELDNLSIIKVIKCPGLPLWLSGKISAYNAGDLGSIPGLGRSPGEGKCYPLQHSGLGNPMVCIVHGVTKSQTQLSDFHFTSLLSKTPCCDRIPFLGGYRKNELINLMLLGIQL